VVEFLLILVAGLVIGAAVYFATPARSGFGVVIALAAGLLSSAGGYWLGRMFVHADVGQGFHGVLWLWGCLAALVVTAAVCLAVALPRRAADSKLLEQSHG
jgi:hypothetical protein